MNTADFYRDRINDFRDGEFFSRWTQFADRGFQFRDDDFAAWLLGSFKLGNVALQKVGYSASQNRVGGFHREPRRVATRRWPSHLSKSVRRMRQTFEVMRMNGSPRLVRHSRIVRGSIPPT